MDADISFLPFVSQSDGTPARHCTDRPTPTTARHHLSSVRPWLRLFPQVPSNFMSPFSRCRPSVKWHYDTSECVLLHPISSVDIGVCPYLCKTDNLVLRDSAVVDRRSVLLTLLRAWTVVVLMWSQAFLAYTISHSDEDHIGAVHKMCRWHRGLSCGMSPTFPRRRTTELNMGNFSRHAMLAATKMRSALLTSTLSSFRPVDNLFHKTPVL